MKALDEAARKEFFRRLGVAIRKRQPGATRSQVIKTAHLWDFYIALFAARLLGSFSISTWKRFATYLHRRIGELDSNLVSICEIMMETIDSDEAWLPFTETRERMQTRAPEDCRCSAEMVQWAVGQGGFWTTSGTYRQKGFPPDRSFEIVFDCGSSTAGGLTRALRAYRPTEDRIDYLFLSHFDLDHTSGIEQLLNKFHVETVVLPLLSPAATLLTSARLASRDGLSDEQVELLTNPGEYLRQRGVQRVVLLQPAPEDDADEPPAAPSPDQPPLAPDGETPAVGRTHLDFKSIGAATPNDSFPNAEVAPHPTTFWLTASDGLPFWQLSPYVHPFEPFRIGTFMQAAYRLLDATGGDTQSAIRTVLTSPIGRRDLKGLYRLVRSDHNALSMSLFSCPLMSEGSSQMWLNVPPTEGHTCLMQMPSPRFGWLHTGDSTLARDSYRSAWLSYYRRALQHVGVLVVPHHGSKHNFHRDLLSVCVPPVAIACAGRKNGFGHPAASVAKSARVHGSAFHQVDEQFDNEVVSVYWS